jgi:hypothetical protein
LLLSVCGSRVVAAGLPVMASSPLFLAIDASLDADKVAFSAYTSLSPELGRSGIALFQQLPISVIASEAERAAMDMMLRPGKGAKEAGAALAALAEATYGRRDECDEDTLKAGGSISVGEARGTIVPISKDLDDTHRAMHRLLTLLGASHSYVQDVVSGKRAADPSVGSAMTEALAAVPRLSHETMLRAIKEGMSDLIMTGYLTSLTSAQLGLAERIVASVPVS